MEERRRAPDPGRRPDGKYTRRTAMLKNEVYNLMETGTVLSKGLHRYGTFLNDAQDCPNCQQIWNYMRQTDEEQLKRILNHLKRHFHKEAQPKVTACRPSSRPRERKDHEND